MHSLGQYHSILYIDCTEGVDFSSLYELQVMIQRLIEPNFVLHEIVTASSLQKDPPHISLSKPFVSSHYLIKSVAMDIDRTLSNSVGHFNLSFDGSFFLLLNECRGRAFLCLGVNDTSTILPNMVQRLDRILSNYGYGKFFTVPRFHLSIASIEKI